MCGIAGIWNLNGDEVEINELEKFTNTLSHRGPDGSGYTLYNNNVLGLGHRRLSILDLSEKGKQPLEYLNGKYSITYNGEIYNFLELRSELRKKGYAFQSDCDTEVILAAYDCWGEECLNKFNGMWAFAIWNNHDKKLFLSRDRFGEKPLHYVFIPNQLFAFASETIAFKFLKGFEKRVDKQLLSRAILSFSSLESVGYTIYDQILQLLPGHYIELEVGRQIVQKKWWNTLDNLPTPPKAYGEQVEYFREIFAESCKIRLRSDVPVATALSGGVDSSAVYCMIHHIMKNDVKNTERLASDWQKAFVATFPDTKVNERSYAEEVIAYTKGFAEFLEPNYTNLINDIEKSTILFDGISGDPIIGITDVYKAMRKENIKVSLDGHGVDEMMYGYRNSLFSLFRIALENNNSDIEEIKNTYLNILFNDEKAEKIKEIENLYKTKDDVNFISRLKGLKYKLFSQKNTKLLPEISSDEWIKEKNIKSYPYIASNFTLNSKHHFKEPIIFEKFHRTDLPYNLRDFDRGSMQYGIELRMPFLDHRLVSFVFSIPQQSKMGDGYTKKILRDAMKGLMPETIRQRKLKIGFGTPMKDWFNGVMSEYLIDEVNSSTFLKSDIFEGDKIRVWVESKNKSKSWTEHDCSILWPYLNAHIISKGQK